MLTQILNDLLPRSLRRATDPIHQVEATIELNKRRRIDLKAEKRRIARRLKRIRRELRDGS